MMAQYKQIVFTVAVLCIMMVSGYKEEVRETMKNCKNGQDVTDAELEEFLKPMIPKTNDEKCLMACVMKNFGLIDNGHYDSKIAFAVLKDLLKNEPEKIQMVKSVIDHCGDDIPKKMDNDCELAAAIMGCHEKYEREAGIIS